MRPAEILGLPPYDPRFGESKKELEVYSGPLVKDTVRLLAVGRRVDVVLLPVTCVNVAEVSLWGSPYPAS